MRNVLAIFYYMLSGLSSEVWFILSIVVPFFVIILLSAVLSCTMYGRFVRSASRASRFIRNYGLVTNEIKDLFFSRCIKGLPLLFTQSYEAKIKDNTPLIREELRPLFGGSKKLLLSLFDMVWMILLTLSSIVALMEGAELIMILFCALAPLPFIIISRLIYKYIIHIYNTLAQTAYQRLVNIINDEDNFGLYTNVSKEISLDKL